MGSESDLPAMKKSAEILDRFNVSYFMTIASAHRTPERVREIVSAAEAEGCKVIIAGAGMAAHLAGFIAAHTVLPVIGAPMASSTLDGIDALLSTVQMPPGVPVATVGIGAAGAKNAGVLAVEILALSDPGLRARLVEFRRGLAAEIEARAADVERSQSRA
jgi:phosphoribosylaminoimidazole carboxylase PurE protein